MLALLPSRFGKIMAVRTPDRQAATRLRSRDALFRNKKAALGKSKGRLSIFTTKNNQPCALFVRVLMGGLGVLVGMLGMFLGRNGVRLAFVVLPMIVMMGRLVVVKRSRLVMGRRTVMMIARSVLLFFLHRRLPKRIFASAAEQAAR